MPTISSKQVIKLLIADGWVFKEQKGSHAHYRHPKKLGKATVKVNEKDIPIGTIKGIEKQTGLKLI